MLPGLVVIAVAAAPVAVVSLPQSAACAGAADFGQALAAGGVPVRVVARGAPPDGSQAAALARSEQVRLVLWLEPGAERTLLLHAAGPGMRLWERRIPAAACDVQRRAAVIAALSLLDPVPALPPREPAGPPLPQTAPVAPPTPPAPPPAPPEPPAPLPARLLAGASADGRLLLDGRLAGGPGLLASLRLGRAALGLGVGALYETRVHAVPGGATARGVEAELRLSRAPRPGWTVGPQLGVALGWLSLEAPQLDGAAPSRWLNPSISMAFLASWCRAGWCATGALEARAWLRREELKVGGLGTVATTPWGALGAGLGLLREIR